MNYTKQDLIAFTKEKLRRTDPAGQKFSKIFSEKVHNTSKWADVAFVSEVMQPGDKLSIRDYGTWEVKMAPGRPVRNPRTNEPLYLPPRVVVKFIPSPRLAEAIQERIGKTGSSDGQPEPGPPAPRQPKIEVETGGNGYFHSDGD